MNNRTHREILVVDGTVAFAGGVVRIEGEAAAELDAAFSESWLEASGEMLVHPRFFPFQPAAGKTKALVVTSSRTTGRSTEARVLVQSLVAKAGQSVHITTPYFLPGTNSPLAHGFRLGWLLQNQQ